jgi:hypothetical protein
MLVVMVMVMMMVVVKRATLNVGLEATGREK